MSKILADLEADSQRFHWWEAFRQSICVYFNENILQKRGIKEHFLMVSIFACKTTYTSSDNRFIRGIAIPNTIFAQIQGECNERLLVSK